MKCRDLMTQDPALCVPSENVVRAAQLMRGEDVGPVLVVDSKNDRKLAGIVTDRDLAVKVVAAGKDPNSTRVKDVMTSDLATVHSDDNVEDAIDVMRKHQVRRVPVLDNDDRLVGIISQADIARELGSDRVGDVVEDVSQPKGTNFLGFGKRGRSSGHQSHERWSSATRLAIAAAGGGLLVYGLRSHGKTRQIATTAGAALVARGVTGKPFEGIGDLMNPARAFGF